MSGAKSLVLMGRGAPFTADSSSGFLRPQTFPNNSDFGVEGVTSGSKGISSHVLSNEGIEGIPPSEQPIVVPDGPLFVPQKTSFF